MFKKKLIFFYCIITSVFTFFLMFLVSEILIRTIDGYPIFSLNLRNKPKPKKSLTSQISIEYLKKISKGNTLEINEFFKNPPLLPKKNPDPFLLSLLVKAERAGLEGLEQESVVKEWNKSFLIDLIKRGDKSTKIFLRFPPETVLFEACENNPHPRYRFPQSVTTPGGLVTNKFGWRGYELDLNKPANTIRISFLGASTTIGLHDAPYSYPEFVGYWLNIWAKKNHYNVNFEIMNTGREGNGSTDIAAIFKQEVAPLEPDISIYYEGSNQFQYSPLLKNLEKKNPFPENTEKRILFFINKFENHSAIARRLKEIWLKIHRTEFAFRATKARLCFRVS